MSQGRTAQTEGLSRTEREGQPFRGMRGLERCALHLSGVLVVFEEHLASIQEGPNAVSH